MQKRPNTDLITKRVFKVQQRVSAIQQRAGKQRLSRLRRRCTTLDGEFGATGKLAAAR